MSAEKRLSDLFHALYDPMTTETLEAQESDLGRDSRDGRGRWAVDDIERGTHVVGPAVRQQLAVIESILAGREKKH